MSKVPLLKENTIIDVEDGGDTQLLSSVQSCHMSYKEVAERLNTSLDTGLTYSDVYIRQDRYGPNELILEKKESLWMKYLEQFKNPLIVMLLISAIVSVLMRQFDDAISITLAIVIVVSVAFVQEYKSEKSIEALRLLLPHVCKCVRDGSIKSHIAEDLVPGDIVVLGIGDRVPADLRLFEVNDLAVDESSFTGETEPAVKVSHKIETSNGISSRKNIAYMGTLVRGGKGKGIVITTADGSEFASLFKLMQAEESPKTPLQKNMETLGKQLTFYSLIIITIIMLLGLLQGRPIHENFNISVSLAVAAIPEGLPIVVTVTLALGVIRMASRRAIVKKLPTVETLGCINVVVSDKTGTLTKNEMTVTNLVTSELHRANVTGVGYNTNGQVEFPDTDYNYKLKEASAELMLKVGYLCSNADVDEEKLCGQPTEGAIVVAALKMGLYGFRDHFERLQEIPFSSETRMMAVRCRARNPDFALPYFPPDKELYIMKGALERVLEKCSHASVHGSVEAMTSDRELDYFNKANHLGRMGLRVLGMAYGATMDTRSAIFCGMVGILDPPRPGVELAVQTLLGSGVDVKMLTGDSKETACAIGERLGLYAYGGMVLSGDEIDGLSDDEICRYISHVSIFYRVDPRHKLRIVKALQANQQIVAMSGDGVNDSPALKRADVGISMGKSGTDVSKEAADMILVDDDFSTITASIEEAKGIFYNIRNFVRFQLSTSIAAMSLIALSTLMHIPSPLKSTQILFINLIMDGPPAQSLGVEPVDRDVLKKPPRNVNEAMINRHLIFNVLLSASIIITGTVCVFMREMNDPLRANTMTFTIFIFFDMFNALSCRSTKSIFTIGFTTNKAFLVAVTVSVIFQLMVIYFSPLQSIFHTVPLSLSDLVTLALISSSVFVVSEIGKLIEHKLSLRHAQGKEKFTAA